MLKKVHKEWVKRELKKGYNESDIRASLDFFLNNIHGFKNKDILSWDAKELEEYIKTNSFVSKRKSKLSDKNNSSKLYEDDRWLVVCPKDKNAATYWGIGTKWCITMSNANYFKQYRDNNITFHFLIDKQGEAQGKYSKIAIVCTKDGKNNILKVEYYLANDDLVSFESLPGYIKDFLSGQ